MFRLESYITPLVMNYLDRYVKLKSEDFQLSLWGGAAVLNKLDLRLDAIESALNLPIKLTSGSINELKIQVPWTKLGSEPVVVTINSMECVLALRNSDDTSDTSSQASSVVSKNSQTKKSKSKKKLQDPELPPGYIQSLLNRIVSNVNIVIENLLLKFVEENIVLSVNVKTLEVFSANTEWKRAFVELAVPDLVLRRVMEFTDVTVCLDKKESDENIKVYQDPMLYRCSVQTRIYTKFANLHASVPAITKIHTLCSQLSVSLTDTQLPLFLRLGELASAIYYGELNTSTTDPDILDEEIAGQNNPYATEEPPAPPEPPPEGWASWAWSYVPSIVPPDEEASSDEEGSEPRGRPNPPIIDLSFYIRRASLVIKMTKPSTSSLKSVTKKVTFEPLCELRTEGLAMEILVKGMIFLDFRLGITNGVIASIGDCVCCAEPPATQAEQLFLHSGSDIKKPTNFMTGCLFDTGTHHGSITTYIFDEESHSEKYKESYVIDRFGALWINYLWIEQQKDEPRDTLEEIEEVSYMKFWFNDITINYTSNMKHRLDKILFCANDHNYEPYAKPREEIVDPDRPVPSAKRVKFLENFIPIKNVHLAILRSCILLYPSNHIDVNVKQHTIPTRLTKKARSKAFTSSPTTAGIKLTAERFDMQITRPMYARRLVRDVSQMETPSGNLLYHCQYHQNIKVMRLGLNVIRENHMDEGPVDLPVTLPVSAACYMNYLMLPMYWKSHNRLERSTSLYELPDMTLAFTIPQLQIIQNIWNSWNSSACRETLKSTSLINDAFNVSGKFSVAEVSLSRFELKQSKTNLVRSAYGTIGSVMVSFITKGQGENCDHVRTIFRAPSETSTVGDRSVFTSIQPLGDNSSEDFISFTYQYPHDSSCQEPVLLLVTVQGWSLSADQFLFDNVIYYPLKISKTSKLAPTSLLVSSLVDATSPLQKGVLTSTDGTTTLVTESKEKTQSAAEPKHSKLEKKKTFLEKILEAYPVIHKATINVTVHQSAILLASAAVAPDDNPSMVEHWRQLGQAGDLPPSLIIALPSMHARTSGQLLSNPMEDIPVTPEILADGGVKLPILIDVVGFSVFTNINRSCLYLTKPLDCATSITFTTLYHNADGYENVMSSLCLSVNNDTTPMLCRVSKPQLELLADIASSGLNCMLSLNKVSTSDEYIPAPPDVSAESPAPAPSRVFEDESIHAVTESDHSRALIPTSPEQIDYSSPCVSVKFHLRIPKAELNIYTSQQQGYTDHCLSAVWEDWCSSLDIYPDYVKLQSKVWALEIIHGIHDRRSGEFLPGERYGILISSKQRMVNLSQLSNQSSVEPLSPDSALSQMMKEKPREGFMTFTFTRALSSSVVRKLNRLSNDLGPSTARTKSTNHSSGRYITELCFDVTRTDIICYLPACVRVVQTFMIDNLPRLPEKRREEKPVKKKSTSSLLFHSKTFPLIHVTVCETRLFLPVESDTTSVHDTIVMTVQAIELTPQADNPLARLVLDDEIYRKRCKYMDVPGSDVEDRQFQIDVVGFSISTGMWDKMEMEERSTSVTISSENPAFEWNRMSKAVSTTVTELYPILASFNLKTTIAPAVLHNEILFCGHSVEVNARSDIQITVCDFHLSLVSTLLQEVQDSVSILMSPVTSHTSHTQSQHEKKTSVKVHLSDYVNMAAPLDVLITGRNIGGSLMGGQGFLPLLNVAFYQPHTVLSTKPGAERLEVSIYDMRLRAGGETIKTMNLRLPLESDFQEYIVSTSPGVPDSKTGIPPCLLTLNIDSFLTTGNVRLVNERPVKLHLPMELLQPNFIDSFKQLLNNLPNTQDTLKTSTSQDKKATSPGLRLTDIYQITPLDTVYVHGAQAMLCITTPSKQRMHMVIQETDGTVKIRMTTGLKGNQLDGSMGLSYTDVQFTLESDGKKYDIVGPVSLSLDISATTHPHMSRLPSLCCLVSSSVIPVTIGNQTLQVIEKTVANLSEQFNPTKPSGKPELHEVIPSTARSLSELDSSVDFFDDLRMGAFKFLLDKEQTIASAHTVLFYSDKDYSTLTWSYAEPRVLKNIHVNPIPFDYPADPSASFHEQDIEISCGLQYYDELRKQYQEYSIFYISEHAGTTVSLPSTLSEQSTAARTWRVIINYFIERRGDHSFESVFAMVSPAVLVAAMKVDSSFIPSMLPMLQCAVKMDGVRINVLNQYSGGQGHHKRLHPFTLKNQNEYPVHEVFQCLLSDSTVDASIWAQPGGQVKVEFASRVTAKYLDYAHLAWKEFLYVDDMILTGDMTQESHMTTAQLGMRVSEIECQISQGVINAGLQLSHVWTQKKKSDLLPLTAHYTICNNTHSKLTLEQFTCEQTSVVCIGPGQAQAFCWHKRIPQQLHFYAEEWHEKWCEPFSLDTCGTQVVKMKTPTEGEVNIFVTIEQLSGLHRIIVISGAISVCSRLQQTELEVRLGMTTSHQKYINLSPHLPFCSFIANTGKLTGIRLRERSGNSVYSQEVKVNGTDVVTPLTVKIGGEGVDAVDVWCSIIARDIGNDTQYCLELSPLYIVQSYVPHDLVLNILPSIHLWVRSCGMLTEVPGLNAVRTYQMGLQMSESSTHAAVMLPLSVDKFEQLKNVSSREDQHSVYEICRQACEPKNDVHWPSDPQEKRLAGRFQQLTLTPSQSVLTQNLQLTDPSLENVGLEIEWNQERPGSRTLLMSVKPKCVIKSNLKSDLTLMYNSKFCLLTGGEMITAPEGFTKAFSLGVYAGERIFTTEMIQLSDEDIGPRSYFIPDEAILFPDSFTQVSIVTYNDDTSAKPRVLHLVVMSHVSDGVRIITVHSRFTLYNKSSQTLLMSTLMTLVTADKLSLADLSKTTHKLESNCTQDLGMLNVTREVTSVSNAALFCVFQLSEEDDWSYPCQLPVEAESKRLTLCAPDGNTSYRSFLITTHVMNGITYAVIAEEQWPMLVIHNHCQFHLSYGQTVSVRGEEVLESMNLLAEPPRVKGHGIVSYTFPTVNRRFPSHVPSEEYPRLKFAGCNDDYGIELWSEAVDITESCPLMFLHIPEIGDVKLTIESCQLSRHIHIETAIRADIMARETLTKTKQVSTEVMLPRSRDSSINEEFLDPIDDSIDESIPEKPRELHCSASLLIDKISVLLLDELSLAEQSQEFLRFDLSSSLMTVNMGGSEVIKKSSCSVCTVELHVCDINIHNQLFSHGAFDFPVILHAKQVEIPAVDNDDNFHMLVDKVIECSLLSVQLTLQTSKRSTALTKVKVISKPMNVELEDALLQSLLRKTDSFLTLVAVLPETQKTGNSPVPLHVMSQHFSQVCGIRLVELHLHKCELLVSVHASLKVFLATDHAPISLREFHRTNVITSVSQLLTDLGFHYGRGALYSAGWVVGSMELLFNPTGLVRSFSTGFSDLIYLPYYGLQRGPGAFVSGVSQGMTSVIKNVTQGTLTSVTNFAQSVSRNMDRLSLDQEHFTRQEAQRRHKPQALGQGFKQGLNGLVLSLLGAVAGLADQPMQGLLGNEQTSTIGKATGVATGMGKGLIGVVTKPISGTAEFIAQTGLGLMHSIGLASSISASSTPVANCDRMNLNYSLLKYRWLMPMLCANHGEIITAIKAAVNRDSSDHETVMLLLFPDVVIVFNCWDNSQQQAFALSEIDCDRDFTYEDTFLRIYLSGMRAKHKSEDESSSKHRVEEYVDATSGYGTMVDNSLGHLSKYRPVSTEKRMLLHEYSVSPHEVDLFLSYLRTAKQQLEGQQ